jgi:hypothetical protein
MQPAPGATALPRAGLLRRSELAGQKTALALSIPLEDRFLLNQLVCA